MAPTRAAGFVSTTIPSTGDTIGTAPAAPESVTAGSPWRSIVPTAGSSASWTRPIIARVKSSTPIRTFPPSSAFTQAWPGCRPKPSGRWNHPAAWDRTARTGAGPRSGTRASAGAFARAAVNLQNGTNAARNPIASRYSIVFEACRLESIPLSITSPRAGKRGPASAQDRHAIDDPPERHDAQRDDRHRADDLHPARHVHERVLPVERDDRDVDPVEHHAHDREQRCRPDRADERVA